MTEPQKPARQTLVALHGWFGWSDGWGRDFRHLVEHALDGHVDVRWVDYRGYGERMADRGDYTLDEIAADVLGQLEGVDSFIVMGHSMGGAAALRLASLAPDRVRAIVGISPVGAAPTPFDPESHALFYGAAEDDAKRAAILDLTTGSRHSQHWLDLMVEESRRHSTTEAFAGHLASWATADFSEEVPPDIPALVVVGAHDQALGEETIRATWMPLLPRAELVVLPRSGHYSMFEEPIALADAVIEFVRAH